MRPFASPPAAPPASFVKRALVSGPTSPSQDRPYGSSRRRAPGGLLVFRLFIQEFPMRMATAIFRHPDPRRRGTWRTCCPGARLAKAAGLCPRELNPEAPACAGSRTAGGYADDPGHHRRRLISPARQRSVSVPGEVDGARFGHPADTWGWDHALRPAQKLKARTRPHIQSRVRRIAELPSRSRGYQAGGAGA